MRKHNEKKIVSIIFILSISFTLLFSLQVFAEDFEFLDEALPNNVDAKTIAPVFDFDGDGALPAAGISRLGEQNAGLDTTGLITGDCRSSNFLDESNTLHRYASITSNGSTYCGHFYALYFEKDQIFDYLGGGHRHDWEYVAIWTKDGVITHGSYSAHGDLYTDEAENIPSENGHLKFVYHKDGLSTHCFRFAKTNEEAENPYGEFVTPAITSWYSIYGDGISNSKMRELLNTYDYGSATIPNKDSRFLTNLNEFKPSSYPVFTSDSINNSN
jgi:hypothetical protein